MADFSAARLAGVLRHSRLEYDKALLSDRMVSNSEFSSCTYSGGYKCIKYMYGYCTSFENLFIILLENFCHDFERYGNIFICTVYNGVLS
jgi:hypothetical protein